MFTISCSSEFRCSVKFYIFLLCSFSFFGKLSSQFVGLTYHSKSQTKKTSAGTLRLAVHLILCAKEDSFVAMFGTVCSSWVHMNCFTSKRSILLPEGDWSLEYIENANRMVSRFLSRYSDWYVFIYCFVLFSGIFWFWSKTLVHNSEI